MNKNGPLVGALIIVVAVALGAYLLTAQPVAQPGSGAPAPVTFYCGGNSFTATFTTSTVALAFDDGTNLTLPQTMSGSGIRYEATSTPSAGSGQAVDLLFMGKGDWGAFTNSASTTDMRYADCTAAHVTSASAAGMNQYEDLGKTFAFSYPTAFQVAGIEPGYGPGWSAPATTTGMVLAKIYVPKSFEPGTNFGDAWFTVGTSADPSAVATCLENLNGSMATTTASFGGQTYTRLAFYGAGAGNRYDTTSYRLVKDNQCYAIEYTVHYGVLENYPKGAVQAFDEPKVASALDQIAQSFQFVP